MAYDVSKLVNLGQLKSLASRAHLEDQSVLGTSSDASSAITVYGARALANSKLSSVQAGSGITVATTGSGVTSTTPKVSVRISAKAGNIISVETGSGEQGLYASAPSSVVYSMVKDQTATTGMAATYHLTADGTNTGAAIDIPKDFLVKSATLETVTTKDVPYTGANVGDKYIDFVINSEDGQSTESHIYLPVNDLVDVYTGSNAIGVSNANVISLTLDSSNANGLQISSSGLKLNTVVASTSGAGGSNGAMTASQAEKLAGIATGATKVQSSSTNGKIKINGTETTVYTLPSDVVQGAIATDAEVAEVITEVFGAAS